MLGILWRGLAYASAALVMCGPAAVLSLYAGR